MIAALQGEDGVLTLTLSAPEKRNALDYAMVADLNGRLRAADSSNEVRCVLIRADGPAFSAGGNLREFKDEITKSETEINASGEVWSDLLRLAPNLAVPLVVAVNGPTRAGAVGLVALGDVVIAGESADFSLSEINVGLFPLMVFPAVAKVTGIRAAREMALTGRVVGAQEAAALGLVSRVVPDAELRANAHEAAAALADKPPNVMAQGRKAMARQMDLPYDAAVSLGRSLRPAVWRTPDIREGIEAFLERRTPDWRRLSRDAQGKDELG